MRRGRTKKVRYIQEMPKIDQFSPRGKPGRPDEIELKIDEFEAIKISDFQGLDQAKGAILMGLSRPSFGRLLRKGRKILADALVNGKIIRIRTADVQVGIKRRTSPDLSQNSDSPGKSQEEGLRRNILKY
ncbi:MAG: DUF134 domain-containing protein [Candidatus Omnitrophica bacterium]|nr:DUF134 domain-containing protein [Candidatus Omnitrophota bacterium]